MPDPSRGGWLAYWRALEGLEARKNTPTLGEIPMPDSTRRDRPVIDHSNGVREILAHDLCYTFDGVQREKTLDIDLGADSLDRVDFGISLERAFDLEISDADIEKWKTVGDVIDYINRRTRA